MATRQNINICFRPSKLSKSAPHLSLHLIAYTPAFLQGVRVHTHTHTHQAAVLAICSPSSLSVYWGQGSLKMGDVLYLSVSTWGREDRVCRKGKHGVAQGAPQPAEFHSSAHISPLEKGELTPPAPQLP